MITLYLLYLYFIFPESTLVTNVLCEYKYTVIITMEHEVIPSYCSTKWSGSSVCPYPWQTHRQQSKE